MGARQPALIAAAVLAAACAAPEAAPLHPGSTVPAAWRTSAAAADEPTLFWVFRTADCLTCQNLDFEVRRVQRRLGERVRVVVVHVGAERDEAIPRAYLRERRVRAELRTVPAALHRRILPDTAIPAVYLADHGVIRWHTRLSDNPDQVSTRLDRALAALAAPADPSPIQQTEPRQAPRPQ